MLDGIMIIIFATLTLTMAGFVTWSSHVVKEGSEEK
ncbi:hypothetical protein QFZ72_003382 [Bacillus sp. V2I10]|nr:signal peptide protein [Bacillus sp. V2I10]MDQ0859903.1 hypothetical protein [Bacillus sp. V2I10]